MTLLGFQERFVPNVLAGYSERVDGPLPAGAPTPKRHSIRRVPKDGKMRFKVGDAVQLYRRIRQPDMRKIVDVDPVCTKIERIEIRPGEVQIEGRVITIDSARTLAAADGFASIGDFYEFFLGTEGDMFEGHIIHWDWK